MNCREFLRDWDLGFDARDDAGSPAGREAHAASCDGCRDLDRGYRALRQAIAVHSPPAAPADLADRVLAGWGRGRAGESRPRRRFVARAILVAGLAASVALFWVVRPGGRPAPAPRSLGASVSEAAAASMDLAREASAPAARIGRNVLAASRPGDLAWPSADGGNPASSVLAAVGKQFGDGVRPLSGSARKAFGFLALPAADRRSARPEG